MSSDCIFCKIATGEIPADVVHETATVLAFRDISPKAPVHVLVVPKEHVGSLEDTGDGHRELLGEVLLATREVARREGVSETGYRTVLNTGPDGGQEVPHMHLHVLGGRSLTWPPG